MTSSDFWLVLLMGIALGQGIHILISILARVLS